MTNDTETLTLTDFLLARIAEDEANLDTALWYHDLDGKRIKPRDPSEPVEITKARIFRRELAECEAKQRIVEEAKAFGLWEGSMGEAALQALAAVYADHPDYRDEWRYEGWR